MIFKDEFLQKGEQGGQNAAKELYTTIDTYLSQHFPHLISPKIMTKLYVNVKGLGDSCLRAGIITDPTLVDDFARGFNNSMPLFDLVDIGSAKNKTHDKIGGMRSLSSSVALGVLGEAQANVAFLRLEMLKLHIYNCHCHQIFVGCSQDNEYAAILENSMADGDLLGRLCLIEGIPFEKEFESIKSSYRVTKFPELFRNTKPASVWAPWKAAVATKSRSMLTPSPIQHTVSPSRNSTATPESGNSGTVPTVQAPNSGEFQVVRSKTAGLSAPKTVERNKYGQRVDRLDFKTVPRDELSRIKKLKLCNFYFLQGECPNDNCYHDHSRKLTKNELFILKAIARMTPCRFGLECDDPECMYGHRCPQSEPGRKDCYWGTNCRFDNSAHGIDTNIVKVTKI